MDTQGTRLGTLHETGEQLIRDAEYHNSTAKEIRDQLQDFDGCWEEITNSVKERKQMVSAAITRISGTQRLLNFTRFKCGAYSRAAFIYKLDMTKKSFF